MAKTFKVKCLLNEWNVEAHPILESLKQQRAEQRIQDREKEQEAFENGECMEMDLLKLEERTKHD